MAKLEKSNIKKDRQASLRRIYWILGVLVSIIALALIDAHTPLGGGQVKYYAKWIDCGRQPLRMSGLIGGNIEYYEKTPAFSLFRDNHIEYYCTPKEAEKAGNSVSPNYRAYPNLTQDELRHLRTHGPIEP